VLLGQREGLQSHDEGVGTVPDGGLERRSQILRPSDVEKLRLETQGPRRPLDLLPLRWNGRVAHIEEGGDSCSAWNQVPEQLDPFRVELRHDGAQPRDIATRMGKAGDDALPNRIADPQDDYGNRYGGVLGGQRGRCPPRQDHVWLQSEQLRGEDRESFVLAIG